MTLIETINNFFNCDFLSLGAKSSAQTAIQFSRCHLRVFTMTNVDLNSNNAVCDAQKKCTRYKEICIQKRRNNYANAVLHAYHVCVSIAGVSEM